MNFQNQNNDFFNQKNCCSKDMREFYADSMTETLQYNLNNINSASASMSEIIKSEPSEIYSKIMSEFTKVSKEFIDNGLAYINNMSKAYGKCFNKNHESCGENCNASEVTNKSTKKA